jgi:hypothetical protein
MPRYFFHVRDSKDISLDSEGVMLISDEHARAEAIKAAREMLAEKILNGEVVDGAKFEVVRLDGTIIAIVPLRSVLRLD